MNEFPHPTGCWHTAQCDARRWQQLLQYHQIRRHRVGYDFAGSGPGRAERLQEAPVGGPWRPGTRRHHVDDLAGLVDRSVHIAPLAGDLHLGLIHVPAVANGVAAWSGGVGEQRREPPHPPIDRTWSTSTPAR